ncbi:MAG: hypothetical protein ACHQAY_00240 [Hyphomicrobiales bacterium]
MLRLVEDDDYRRGGDRWRYRGDGGGEGDARRYGRRGDGDEDDWHPRRMQREWCFMHPGRC